MPVPGPVSEFTFIDIAVGFGFCPSAVGQIVLPFSIVAEAVSRPGYTMPVSVAVCEFTFIDIAVGLGFRPAAIVKVVFPAAHVFCAAGTGEGALAIPQASFEVTDVFLAAAPHPGAFALVAASLEFTFIAAAVVEDLDAAALEPPIFELALITTPARVDQKALTVHAVAFGACVRGHDGRFDQPQGGEGDEKLKQSSWFGVSHCEPSQAVVPGHEEMVTRRGPGRDFML